MRRIVKVTFEKKYDVEAESMQEARIRARELAELDFPNLLTIQVGEAYDPDKSVADILRERSNG